MLRCQLPGHTVLTHEELETGLKVHHELRTGYVIPWVPEAFLARSNTRELWCLTFSFEGHRPIMSAFNLRTTAPRKDAKETSGPHDTHVSCMATCGGTSPIIIKENRRRLQAG